MDKEKYLKPVADFLENNDWVYNEPELACLQYDIVDEMEKDNVGFEIVQDIIELMEANTLAEFGTPGGFTFFVEKFYKDNTEEYQKILKKSVVEKPAMHTIWLLHRVTLSTEGETRAELVQILRSISQNNDLHENLRQVADNFLEYY